MITRLAVGMPLFALVYLILSLVGLGTGLAQSIPQTRTVDVLVSRNLAAGSCAAEDLSLKGVMRLMIQTTTAPNGSKQSLVVTDLRGIEAKGLKSQDLYRLDNQRRDRQDFGCGPGERCLTNAIVPFSLVGLGSDARVAGTLLLHLVADPHSHVTGNLVDSRFACRQ
jgi:hypothetical protein